MWWLIAGIAVAALFDSGSKNEKKAMKRWEAKKDEVQRTVVREKNRINYHIETTNFEEDFYRLNNIYYSSRQTADLAYRIYLDAKLSYRCTNKMLFKALKKKQALNYKLISAKKNKYSKNNRFSKNEVKEMQKEFIVYKDAVTRLRKELYVLEKQKNKFYNELLILNDKTRSLKLNIRDCCGNRGRVWYEKLESRRNKYLN